MKPFFPKQKQNKKKYKELLADTQTEASKSLDSLFTDIKNIENDPDDTENNG